ncbi:poly [ADP-ribose] polymerase 2-like [Clavelina lepadiformis]|uniref:poly [ADP-ribose] polymerase 2-like n=1 Tax=Clavelina lepadiformis TaxID=159417 RepID=UPI004042D0F6
MPRTKSKRKSTHNQQKTAIPVKKDKTEVSPSTSKEESKEEKVVKFTGKVPIDEEFRDYANGPYHVYVEGDTIFDVMLNQTNIGQNNNKYYRIQIIKHNTKSEFVTLCRWGRVGKVAGKSNTNSNNVDGAKKEFSKKYHDKTGSHWGWPDAFQIQKPGKYVVIKLDYGEDDDKKKGSVSKKVKEEIPSKLDERVQSAISLIFNKTEWEAAVKEMKFDVNKSPLGKLTKGQIKAGYESLKAVETCLKPGTHEKELMAACSDFYTKVPHDFGMKRPPLIRTKEELKEKLDLLEALDDIQIAINIVKEDDNTNKLDSYYDSLNCDLEPLEKTEKEFKTVQDYVKTTHGHLHFFKLKLKDVFKVKRETDNKKFQENIGNRMLLWHGSRITNWCGILSQGLRIAPPEAPVTGYMFGKGVYFADVVSKSAQYCFASARQPHGFLLLCEVALGGINEKTQSDYNANRLPQGKHSTKGLGMHAPNPKKHATFSGVKVPLGKPVATKVKNTWLRYNEYIVYDTAQIKPRYLVKVSFEY